MVQIDAAAEVESFRNRGIVRMVMRQLFSTSSQGVGIHRPVSLGAFVSRIPISEVETNRLRDLKSSFKLTQGS